MTKSKSVCLTLLVACAAVGQAAVLPIKLGGIRFEPSTAGPASGVRFAGVGLKYKAYFEETGVRLAGADGSEFRLSWPGGASKIEVTGESRLQGTSSYFIGDNRADWRLGLPQYERVVYKNVYPGIDVVFYGRDNELEFDFLVHPGANASKIRIAAEGAESIQLAENGNLELRQGSHSWILKRPVAYQMAGTDRQQIASSYRIDAKRQIHVELGDYDGTKELVIDPSVLFSTYFGGPVQTYIRAVTLDSADNIYIAGVMGPPPFPGQQLGSGYGIFVTKFSPNGETVLYSVYLGGNNFSETNAIVVDQTGSAYVTGSTRASNFPTASAVQSTFGGVEDAFVFKLNPAGTSLTYSTNLGGSDFDAGNGITVDGSGNAIVTGGTRSTNFPLANAIFSTPGFVNVFVTKLNATGNALAYSTFLGNGSGTAVTLDAIGNVYVAGVASQTLTPAVVTTPGAYRTVPTGLDDVFVTKLSPNGSTRIYSTFLGTPQNDMPVGIRLDAAGNAYIGGQTADANGAPLAFVGKLNATGSSLLNWKTLIGGRARAIAVTPSGEAFLAGIGYYNFPVVDSLQAYAGGDAFVAALSADGNTWKYATLIGGSNSDEAYGVAVDRNGNAIIAGSTGASNFPLLNPIQATPVAGSNSQGFVAKIAACGYGMTPASNSFAGAGGSGTIAVTAIPACSWTAVSDAAWLTVTAGATGAGDGTVTYSVSGYPGYASRTASILIGGSKFTVTQTGLPCTYTLGAASANHSRLAESGTVAVSAGAECGWGASSPRAWASIVSGATGMGNGVVGYSIVANNGTARSVTITIAGQPFTINQATATASSQPEFAEPLNYPQNEIITFIKSGDFNGDGKADIAAATGSGAVNIYLGDGKDGLTKVSSRSVPINSSQVIPIQKFAVADLNSDGRSDVFISGTTAVQFNGNFLTFTAVMLCNVDGTLSAPVRIDHGKEEYLATIADLDADGRLDALFVAGTNYIVYRGNGDGSFAAPRSISVYPTLAPENTIAGDLNGDGLIDLIGCQSNGNYLLVNRAVAPLRYATNGPSTLPISFGKCLLRDVNADGKLDLVVGGDGASGIQTLYGTGAATFLAGPVSPSSIANQTYAVDYELADLDSDGKLDMVVNHRTNPAGIATVIGDGAGSFGAPLFFPVGQVTSMAIVDLNRDGKPDVVATMRVGSGSTMTVLLNATVPATGPAPGSIAPILAGLSPSTTTANPQTFTVTARDADGYADIKRMYFLVNTVPSVPAGSCHGFYDRASGGIYLYNDALTAVTGPLAPGAAGTIQNSQCAINGAASSVSTSGTDIVLSLHVTRQGSYSTGVLNFYVWVTDNGGAGTGWIPSSVWTPGSVTPQPPTLAAATPTASSTATQTFTLTGRDANQYSDINRMYFLANGNTSIQAGSCHGFYDRAANSIYLYNDGLSAIVGPLTPGIAGTIQNSQCSINGAASSVTASGTDVVLNLSITRQGSYATGTRNLYIWVTDNANTGTGWVQASTWTLAGATPVPPTLASATPSSSTTATQTFALTGRDLNGFADINRMYFLVNSTTSIPAGSCHGFYDRATNSIFLYNDALTAVGAPLTPGAAGTIQNSQCVINGALSSVVTSGTDVVLNLSITRQGSYATSTRNLYIWVIDNANTGTGWVQASTWTLSGATPVPPTLASAAPSASATATQTFALTGRDLNGFADINRMYFLVDSTTSIPAGSCHGFYDRATNAIFLYNDALTAVGAPLTPGTAGTIQNSQCVINGALSSVVTSGTDVVLNLSITRQGSYATGTRNLYIWVTDNADTGTGWVQASTWTLAGATPAPPTLASATPSSSTTATQTFALTGRDLNGFADINRMYFLVNSTTSIPAGSCHGFYDRATNSIFLYNDALTAVGTALTPGAAGTIQNSQCVINGALSSVVTSGTDIMLNLSITRQGSYATGTRNLYIWVTDNADTGTGWVQASAWTI